MLLSKHDCSSICSMRSVRNCRWAHFPQVWFPGRLEDSLVLHILQENMTGLITIAKPPKLKRKVIDLNYRILPLLRIFTNASQGKPQHLQLTTAILTTTAPNSCSKMMTAIAHLPFIYCKEKNLLI